MSEDKAEEMIEVPPPKEIDREELDINLLVYGMFLNYPDPDQVPVKAIGEQLGISFQKVGALLGSAKWNPSTYQRLLEVGYSDGQIPKWIPREAPGDQQQAEQEPSQQIKMPLRPPGAGIRPPIGIPVPMGQTETGTSGQQGQGREDLGLGRLELGRGPSALSQVYGQEDEVRRNLEKANIVQTNDGRWVQPQTMEDGSVRMVEVDDSGMRARILHPLRHDINVYERQLLNNPTRE